MGGMEWVPFYLYDPCMRHCTMEEIKQSTNRAFSVHPTNSHAMIQKITREHIHGENRANKK